MATARPLGRVVGVPRVYRMDSPTAQPNRIDRARAVAVMPPVTMFASTIAATTTIEIGPKRGRSINRAMVMKATRPARIALSGGSCPGVS